MYTKIAVFSMVFSQQYAIVSVPGTQAPGPPGVGGIMAHGSWAASFESWAALTMALPMPTIFFFFKY